eukprot:15066411-Ditylum_brightwellii.AAC.1
MSFYLNPDWSVIHNFAPCAFRSMTKGIYYGGEECCNHWDTDMHCIRKEYALDGYPMFQRIR